MDHGASHLYKLFFMAYSICSCTDFFLFVVFSLHFVFAGWDWAGACSVVAATAKINAQGQAARYYTHAQTPYN
jgi:hypothetical protein